MACLTLPNYTSSPSLLPLFHAASDTLAILIFLELSSRTHTSDTLHLWTSLPEALFSQTFS